MIFHEQRPKDRAPAAVEPPVAASSKRDDLRGKSFDAQVQMLAPAPGAGEQAAGGEAGLFGWRKKGKDKGGGAAEAEDAAPQKPVASAEQKQSAAQAEHAKRQARLDAVIKKGLDTKPAPGAKATDLDVVFRNACQMIEAGQAQVVMLSPTHDSGTRDPRQGRAMFDAGVKWPATGGSYPLDAGVKTDPALEYTNGEKAFESDGVVYLACDPSETTLKTTLPHELQHHADGHDAAAGLSGADAEPAKNGSFIATSFDFEMYMSEFRAYYLQDSQAGKFGKLAAPAKNDGFIYKGLGKLPGAKRSEYLNVPVDTNFANEVQENIFHHMHTTQGYEQYARFYTCDPAFKAKVDAATSPASVNLIDSPRVATLLGAVGACTPKSKEKSPEVEALRAAAKALDVHDRGFLGDRALSQPFWDKAAACLSSKLTKVLTDAVSAKG